MATAKSTKSEVKKVTDLEIKRDKEYVFQLTKKHDGKYIIAREMMTYDEHTDSYRHIRIADGEESPYVDEQRESSSLSNRQIMFTEGKLRLRGTESNIIRYLLASDLINDKKIKHSLNKSLPFYFELINKEDIFRKQLSDLKLQHKAEGILYDATIDEVSDFLLAFYNYEQKSDTNDEILAVALGKAKDNPSFVIDNFSTEKQKVKTKVVKALKSKKLSVVKGSLIWSETQTEVGKFQGDGIKIADSITDWVLKDSKEAKDFISRLSE